MNIRAVVTITGKVQGVCFRQHTMQNAQKLHVSGWVKNLADGSVQGCFEGDETAVENLIAWCRQGPPLSRVSGVQVVKEPYAGQFNGFFITD